MAQPIQQKKKSSMLSNCFWCFHSARWKREEILDHSFSLINVNDYLNKSLTMRVKYLWIYFLVFKTVMVYMSDLYLLISSYLKKDGYSVAENCQNKINDFSKPIGTFTMGYSEKLIEGLCNIGKEKGSITNLLTQGKNMFFLLLFSILVTYLLSYLELKKAQKIIKSKNISFAFTNIVAYRYYCIKSYAYYCFFQLIQDHKKRSDAVAFFVFFTFKGKIK